jgi:hypothetical protein
MKTSKDFKVDKNSLKYFHGFVVYIKCQKLSHDVRYSNFCKCRNFRHLEFVQLILYYFIVDVK